MDVRLPDGTVIRNVPDGTTKAQLMERLGRNENFVNFEKPQTVAPQVDPTESMSGTDKFLAGVGKRFTDVARGGEQLAATVGDALPLSPLGLARKLSGRPKEQIQADISEAKRLNAPLMKTGAGLAGDITGNIAAAVPLAFVPGANTVLGGAAVGGGMGMLDPSESTDEAVRNVALGGFGGGLGVAAGRVAPGIVKAFVDPFRKQGQEKIVGETLRRFAGDNADDVLRAASKNRFVNGWQPTLAEAAQNPGISILERGAGSVEPQTAAAIASRAMENNAAALNAVGKIAGTADDKANAKIMRDFMASPLYREAAEEGVDGGMAKALKPQIDSLLARPSIKKAIQKAQELAGEQGLDLTDMGSVKGLQYLKQSLDDFIEKAPTDSSIGKNTLRALRTTRADLISVLDDLAPKQRAADRAFAQWSRPINEQAVGDELLKRLQPALGQFNKDVPNKLYADAYARTVRDLGDKIPKITGFPGATLEGVMSPGAMNTINQVGEALAKRSAANELGRGVGSNTAQNLASQNIMRQVFGPVGLPQSWAESVLTQTLANRPLGMLVKPAEQRVQGLLSEALLDPQMAAKLMQQAARRSPSLIGRGYTAALPVTGGASGLLMAE